MRHLVKRVLFIGPQYKDHRGGIGAVIESYSYNIDDFKFVATHDGKYGHIANILIFLYSLYKVIMILIKDGDIDIIHIHGASKGSFFRKYIIFLIGKYLFRKKIVYHLHGAKFHIFYEQSNRFVKKHIGILANNVDIFICLSSYWYRYLSQNFNIQKLLIINNPVPAPKKIYPKSKEYNKMMFLFLGRIGERKGIFDFVDVVSRLSLDFRDKIKVVIGGDGEVEKLINKIDKFSLNEIFEYVGWTKDLQKQELLGKCDVLILPSYNEGLPISILEAMSYGKAILSTNVGGIPEIIEHGTNGFLIEPGDLTSLESHLKFMIKNPNIVEEMGCKSKERVQPFLIENVLNDLDRIYSSLSKH